MSVKTPVPTVNQALAAWARLARLYAKTVRGIERELRPLELTLIEFDALAQLGAREGLVQQDLADHLLVSEGNITYLTSKLARRELIERRSDGRCKRLYLTSRGRALLEAARPTVERFHQRQFGNLEPSELHTLLVLLRRADRQTSPLGTEQETV
ncbi:DNA-binding MarR family transcriptional regulator [Deinobacterium chartae]|uniref:DNA-binding MarR family transcriptional regulator n=1 Tax=Deinobacterium chartae TaxID=521158 RepID=A0A841I1G0_9DEIO|nr:DNA-binding MarR family transcriptional regulator [Deinobacterium chartae]